MVFVAIAVLISLIYMISRVAFANLSIFKFSFLKGGNLVIDTCLKSINCHGYFICNINSGSNLLNLL